MVNTTGRTIWTWAVAACALAVPMAAVGQDQTPGVGAGQTVIRTEVREVLVEVAVRDKMGRSQRGLTVKDFTIWEDGKKQAVTSFSPISADLGESPKYLVLYLSDDADSDTWKAVALFVEATAAPDRYRAILTFGWDGPRVLQNFTTSSAKLQKAIDARPLPSRRPFTVAPCRAVAPSAPGSSAIGAQQSPGFCSETGVGLPDFSASLRQVADSMAPAPGRKALVLLGIRWPASKSAVAACNKANVAVYDASRYLTADALVRATGGATMRTSGDIAENLTVIAREQDEYYRLGYTPPDSPDGSCHPLRVKVGVSGADVRARNEYCTKRELTITAGAGGLGNAAVQAVAPGRGGLHADMRLPYFRAGANRATVHLAFEFVPAGVRFQKEGGKLVCQLNVLGIASRPDSGTAARFSDTVRLEFENQQQVDAFARTPYHYENQFAIVPGEYLFRMVLGAGEQVLGTMEAPFGVGSWDPAKLGIGSIVLGKEVHAAADPSSGPLLLEGRAPLVAGGLQTVPTGASRFPRTERVYFYTEVYDPLLAANNPPAFSLQFRVLDLGTGEVKQDSGITRAPTYVQSGNSVAPVIGEVRLRELPAGSYRLEVTVRHPSMPETAVSTVDFELD